MARVPVTLLLRGAALVLVLFCDAFGRSVDLAGPRVEGRAGRAESVCLEGRELSPPRRDGFFMKTTLRELDLCDQETAIVFDRTLFCLALF